MPQLSSLPRELERIQFALHADSQSRALFLKAFLFGRDEAWKSGAALLQQSPELCNLLMTILLSILDQKPLPGMMQGEYGLHVVLDGLRTCVTHKR